VFENLAGAGHRQGIGAHVDLTAQSRPIARWDSRLARALGPFLGRDAELSALTQAMELARAGKGQVIEVGGDLGIGKSRLVYEFTGSEAAADCGLFTAGTASYAKDHPYFSLSSLLRNLLRIERHDDYSTVTEKISAALGRDSSLAVSIPALRSLLDLPAEGAAWVEADPGERRSQIVIVLRDVILSFARKAPVILVYEDLQWIDEESQCALDVLIRAIADASVLILLTSRTAVATSLSHHRYYRRIVLPPLDEICAHRVLDHVLGGGQEFEALKAALIARSQGNPLFLEEIARMVAESSRKKSGKSAFS
jgi:predicted ATPase